MKKHPPSTLTVPQGMKEGAKLEIFLLSKVYHNAFSFEDRQISQEYFFFVKLTSLLIPSCPVSFIDRESNLIVLTCFMFLLWHTLLLVFYGLTRFFHCFMSHEREGVPQCERIL